MAKRVSVVRQDGPHTAVNRDLMNRLYKTLLHPSWWDDRPLLEFAPRDHDLGVMIKIKDKGFTHILPKLRQFFNHLGYETRTVSPTSLIVRESV